MKRVIVLKSIALYLAVIYIYRHTYNTYNTYNTYKIKKSTGMWYCVLLLVLYKFAAKINTLFLKNYNIIKLLKFSDEVALQSIIEYF